MKVIFYLIVFFVFSSPVNDAHFYYFFGPKISLSEFAFLLLPIVNVLIPKNKIDNNELKINSKLLKDIIVIYLGYIITFEFFKNVVFENSFGDFLKSIRLGLPLFSTLIIIYTGIRANIKIIWTVLLVSISISNFLSVYAFMYNDMRFLPSSEDYIFVGRFFNSNFTFAPIGLFLLFDTKKVWYNKGYLPIIASVLSIAGLLFFSNRTFIFTMALFSIWLAYRKFNFKNLVKGAIYFILITYSVFLIYENNAYFNKQLNRRIIPLIYGQSYVIDEAFYNNRDIIYAGIIDRLNNSDWILGLSYSEPMFRLGSKAKMDKYTISDISFINILLRYGFIALFLFVFILFLLINENLSRKYPSILFPFVLAIYVVTSVNYDTLFSRNAVFFLMISFFVFKSKDDMANSTKLNSNETKNYTKHIAVNKEYGQV